MIGIIDYDAGNIKSVEKAFAYLGEEAVPTRDAKELLAADKVVLPGVGSFGDAMENIRSFGLDEVIKEIAKRGTPLLGICLGLQLFFEESEESPGVKGLGLLPGRVLRFKKEPGIKIPHMGWNSLDFPRKSRLMQGIEAGACVYFVHSFYLQAERTKDVIAETAYGSTRFHAAVERGNLFACQFHPEKSSQTGLKILENFAGLKGRKEGCLPRG